MESTHGQFGAGAIASQTIVIDPNTFTVETFLALTRQMALATTTQFNHENYKQADNLLQQFSKTHQAWSVTMQVLNMPGLSEQEYFNAANILKNKMLYDFASLKNQAFGISFQVRDSLILIIKRMAAEGQQRNILNCLCTAMAVLIMHIHEHWTDFVEQISQTLQDSVDEGTCLLLILKYMASDCDNDSIVIEDSIRQNFFFFIDGIAPQVFEQIFNMWAQKILQTGAGQVARSSQAQPQQQELETLKMQRLRSKLVDAFYNWIKLRLPDEIFQTLTQKYPALLQLVFVELENNSEENLENATNCVIELISLARKKVQFSSIKEMVISKVEHLVVKVDQAVRERDEEIGEQLSEIFVELGQGHIDQILSSLTLTIPEILLKLMRIPEISSRRQVPFWKALFKGVGKLPLEEAKQRTLQAMEKVLLDLLNQIIDKVRAEDDLFQEFNFQSDEDEIFDDLIRTRQDFGSLLKNLGRECGGVQILQYLLGRLQSAVQEAQKDQQQIKNWATIESIITCIVELSPALKSTDVPMLKDVVILVFQLPTQYLALRRSGTALFSSLSLLMVDMGEQVKNDVKSLLDYVITGFEHKHLMVPCARAFQSICFDHAPILQPFAAEIINRVIPQQSANNWSNRKEYELTLDGVAKLVMSCKDNQICEQLLKRVIQPLVVPLVGKINSLKNMNQQEGRKLSKNEINDVTLHQIQGYLYLIGDFLKDCQGLKERVEANPFSKLFEEIWQFVQDLINEFTNLDDIVEFAIRIIKSSLRILGRNFDKYLIQFLQIVVKGYEQNHLASFIYAVEFCLSDYHQNRDYDHIFQEVFDHICSHTIQHVLTDFHRFEYYPEVAFDFFGLCGRLLKTNKRIFYSTPYLEGLLNTWIIGIGIEHMEAIKTHTSFFINLLVNLHDDISSVAPKGQQTNYDEIAKQVSEVFVNIHPNEVLVWKYLIEKSQIIVDRLIDVILSAPPRDFVDYVVDDIVAICHHLPENEKRVWFAQAFARIPGNVLTEEEKSNDLSYVVKSHKNKDGLVSCFDVIAKRARNHINRGS